MARVRYIHIWTMHPCCGIISLSVFILSILKLWTLCRKILKKFRMYPTTVVCLWNANSTRSRMAAWCHALSLAVQRLPAMNTVSFLSKSHHSWQAKLIILKPRPFKFLHYHWRTSVFNKISKWNANSTKSAMRYLWQCNGCQWWTLLVFKQACF